MRKSMVILLLAWWLVAPAWGAELPREVRDALPAAAEEITEELEDPASLSEGLSRLWDRALGYVEEAVRQSAWTPPGARCTLCPWPGRWPLPWRRRAA